MSGFTVSDDGRTYTFTLRKGFGFSDGSPVTARSFAYAIDRAANHMLESSAAQFITNPDGVNITGAIAVTKGYTNHVRGVHVRGNRLVVHLVQPSGTFLSILTMPFFQATSTKLPLTTEVTSPYPRPGRTSTRATTSTF